MSTRAWAQLALCPWEEPRQDEAFRRLAEAIGRYGFETDETIVGKDGTAVRKLADSQAPWGIAAFDDLVSLAQEAGLWCLAEDEGDYEWPARVVITAPDGREWWANRTSDGAMAVGTGQLEAADLDLVLSQQTFAPDQLGLWAVSGGPPVERHGMSRRVAANCLARLGVEDGGDEGAWEVALRLASQPPQNKAALEALAANREVPERLRVAAALQLGS